MGTVHHTQCGALTLMMNGGNHWVLHIYANLTRSVKLINAQGDQSSICGNKWLSPQSSSNKDGRASVSCFTLLGALSMWHTDRWCWMTGCLYIYPESTTNSSVACYHVEVVVCVSSYTNCCQKWRRAKLFTNVILQVTLFHVVHLSLSELTLADLTVHSPHCRNVKDS